MGRQLRITADGGSRGNPGPAAFGSVVYEGDQVLVEISEAIGIATNNVAEYSGLVAGLKAAHEIDPTAQIEVCMDSKLVVEQMSGRWQIKHPDMRQLAKQANEIHDRALVKFRWIPREENKHADRLVNLALDGKELTSAAPSSVDDTPQLNYLTERLISGETPTLLYLVRHGETALTPERRFSGDGPLDPELSEKGLAQAQAVAKAITSRNPTRLISSPLRRTKQTAAEISATTGLQVEYADNWREASFGYWDGMSIAEVKAAYPEEWHQWVREIDFAPGGGESYAQVARRANFAVSKLAAQYPGERIVVVTHNAFIKSALAAVMEVSPTAVFHLDVGTCSISTIAIYPSDGLRAIRSVNERSHIQH